MDEIDASSNSDLSSFLKTTLEVMKPFKVVDQYLYYNVKDRNQSLFNRTIFGSTLLTKYASYIAAGATMIILADRYLF